MSKNYTVRLRCPYGDKDAWIILENRDETLEQVMHMTWDLECDAHGVQHEIPLEGNERGPGTDPPLEEAAPAPAEPSAPETNRRSSERVSLRIPVVVYGWTKNQGAFHEETFTLVVNESGALVPLNANVEMGEGLFLINKTTREEQEVRVVHVESPEEGVTWVALAFRRQIPTFWRRIRRKPRTPSTIRVFVKGKDHNGNPFVQSTYTIDISEEGARLDGVGYLTRPGEIIEVKRRWRGKARFRVIWIGEIGTEQANQIGICSIETVQKLWRVKLPEPEEEKLPEPDTDLDRPAPDTVK